MLLLGAALLAGIQNPAAAPPSGEMDLQEAAVSGRFQPIAPVIAGGEILEDATSASGATMRIAESGRAHHPIVPDEPIALFNQEDLTNFYTWLPEYGYDDPNRVFTVVDQIDGAPAIRISGENWGGLITENEYADYHLIVEYRWGPVTWGDRMERARDSGILLHAQGRAGNRNPDFSDPWMHSIEFQIIEGGTGDVILLGGYTEDGEQMTPSFTTTIRQDRDGETVWDPEGESATLERGRINWYGRDPDWSDVLNFRGRDDLENPVGEWNRLDAFLEGDELTYLVNGTIVMKGSDVRPASGKLLFQSEGAEIYFRRIELRPLE